VYWGFTYLIIVCVPKYRYRVLSGPIRDAAYEGIHAICGYAGCEVVEMKVEKDLVHFIIMVPPKIAISDLVGRIKRQTSMKLFKQLRHV
jgi:putative transposase